MIKLLNKISKRADWEWHKFHDAVFRRMVKAPDVMTYEECIEHILNTRASVSRFGDGELAVIHGRKLGFQKQDGQLGRKLKNVLTSNSEGLLICIPDTFQNLERYNQVEQNFWRAHHYYNRKNWLRLLLPGKKYGNTFLSRFYSMEFDRQLAACRLELLRKLWNNRDIIFVEGRDTKLGVGNELFNNASSIRRVICPAKDAFAIYDKILDGIKILERADNNLFILALGPTATVLAADMNSIGLQAVDFGHIDIEYEWYRQGVTKKVPVKGKYSNEAAILGLAKEPVTGVIVNSDYEHQIILDLTK